MNKVNIMGVEYSYRFDNLNNQELATADGVCKIFDKEILIRKPEYMAGDKIAVKYKRLEHVIRHELVHAVANECGVQYGENEDLVDWIAHIIPIVNKAFNEVKVNGD